MRPDKASPFRLLVEGTDDWHSITQLLIHHGYDWNDESIVRPFVEPAGGLHNVLDALAPAIKTYERLGIVVDADLAPGDRWIQIRDRLATLGRQLPRKLPTDGLVVDSPEGPRIGVWLMPNNETPGTLEQFLTTLIPDGDPIWPHAQSATNQAVAIGSRLPAKDLSKGCIHAWLAWQDPPGQPLGLAIRSHAFAHHSPTALRFVDWFRRVFVG